MQTLGILLIVIGGSGMALVALYAIAPSFIRRPAAQPIKIEEKNLLETADLTPKAEEADAWKPLPASVTAASRQPQPTPRVVDELFSELFALRAEVASITQELRTLREQLDESGVLTPKEPARKPTRLRRAA